MKSLVIDGVHGDEAVFMRTLRAIIGPNSSEQSHIDLCSCYAPLVRHLDFKSRVYVDVKEWDIDDEVRPYYVVTDVLGNHPVLSRQYDVATCLDGIEHLHKPDGRRLLDRMKALSKKQILFTPLHPWNMAPDDPRPETHKCVWVPEDLPNWASVVYPVYHRVLEIGAWFFWHCDNLEEDFERVKRELR